MKTFSQTVLYSKEEKKLLDSLITSFSDKKDMFSQAWAQERIDKLQDSSNRKNSYYLAWKAPITHMFIDKFFNTVDNLKFIYVYRNGLDM